MADAYTTFSVLSNDAPNVYIEKKTYPLAEKHLQIGKFATRYSLPQRMSKSLRIVRHSRLRLPITTLTEGVPPDAVALAVENVDVTVEQWGIVVLITDVAELTVTHPALQVAIDKTALAMAEMMEREQAVMLLSGSQVYFGAAAANRAALDGTKKLGTGDILSALAALRALGANEYESGLFGGIIAPQVEADLIGADTTFANAASYSAVRKLDYAEIGNWMGVRFYRGNFLPIYVGVAAPDTNAETATKAKLLLVNGGGSLADGDYFFRVVAREILTDYERKISQTSAAINTDAGADDRITVTTPTSTNYVYDIYMTQVGGSILYKVASRVAASTATTFSTQPAGTEAVAPSPPADTKTVFFTFLCGKNAFGRVELDGMSLQSFVTPKGASWSNPLAQGRKVGQKVMWKSFVIDNNYFARIESNSAYSAQLPA